MSRGDSKFIIGLLFFVLSEVCPQGTWLEVAFVVFGFVNLVLAFVLWGMKKN